MTNDAQQAAIQELREMVAHYVRMNDTLTAEIRRLREMMGL